VVGLQERGLQNSHIKVGKRYFTPGIVHGFPVELRQVFLNLIGNAIQAMPSGGRLRLTVREAFDWNLMRRGVSVSIVDTGVGVKPQDSGRLFEPFFSTKSTKGTGLGLWISKGIIQKYEGRISFRSLRSENGCTTCFRVFLPVSEAMNFVNSAASELAATIEQNASGLGAAMQHA
jgi:signal transduction histidine kinase